MSLKILHLDIETCPATVYTWQLRDQNISIDQIITPTSLLCFSAKWHGAPGTMFFRSTKRNGPEFEKMIRKAHVLLSEADAVCHFNGTTFDIPRLNQEFLLLGLPPTPPIPQIDLKKVVMSKFGMVSSKLAFVGPYLKIGEKVKHEGWDLWRGCLANDRDCWERMERYNIQDVALLEKLYKRLMPWIDQHPNQSVYKGGARCCPNCGSAKLQSRGVRRATTYSYQRWQCQSCGRWSRDRSRDKTRATAAVV